MGDCQRFSQHDFEVAAEARLGPLALELDLDSFQAVWLLHQAALVARNHLEREALAAHDLTWTQFEVLWHLWLFGEQEPRCIAQEVGLSKSATTTVTSDLEQRNLVIRRPDDADRRRVYFKTSRRGSSLMKRVFPAFNHAEATVSQPLEPDEKRHLATLLRKLLGSGPDAAQRPAPLAVTTPRPDSTIPSDPTRT